MDTTAPVTTANVENLGSSVEITLAADDGDGSGVDRIQWEGPGTFWGTYTGPFTRALTDSEPRSSSSRPPTSRATRRSAGP